MPMNKNDIQKINLMVDTQNSSNITSFEINKQSITKKNKFEKLFDYLIHLILGGILYIGLGYIGYLFHSLFRYYILKETLFVFTNIDCITIYSLCFFIQSLSACIILTIFSILYYYCESYYYE